MSLLRVGSTEKYSANWAKAFGERAAPIKGQKSRKPATARGKKMAKSSVKVSVKSPRKKARRG